MERSQGTEVAADYVESLGEDEEEEVVEYVEEDNTSGNKDEEHRQGGTSRAAENKVHVSMDTSGDQYYMKSNMGTVFYQCRAARVASFASNSINIVLGTDLGTKTEKAFIPIGSMDRRGDKKVGETFHGARINKGASTVNQGISLSFDPTTLKCIACTKEHNVISAQQRPMVICLSDQNFVSKFRGDMESCIVVARMETHRSTSYAISYSRSWTEQNYLMAR
jgi:hypothetical protein